MYFYQTYIFKNKKTIRYFFFFSYKTKTTD